MIKEIIHPTLEAKQIIVRTDKDEDIEVLEKVVGKTYPLIRVLDRTINIDQIQDFRYKIGASLLPEISLIITDENNRLREKLKTNIDTITVYLSNNIDGSFSKQEYILSTVYSDPGDDNLSMRAILYVPNLFKREMRAFQSNSIDTIKEICSEVGLGLSSNFTPSDEQVRLQDNITNIDFIRNTAESSQCLAVHMFIDQWSYLNVIDIKKAHETNDVIEYTVNPYSGIDLEEPQNLVLSNNYLKTDIVGKIMFWSVNDSYGIKSLSYVSLYDIENFDLVELDKTDTVQITAESEELRAEKRKLLVKSDNVWDGYFQSKYYGNFVKDTLNQSAELIVRMQYPLHAIHPGLSLPVEIFNTQKRTNSYDQEDENLSIEEMPQETGDEARKLVKNELYSGQYYVRQVEMNYNENIIEQTLYLKQI
ncbi:gp129 [Sphingomonas phage PAU]|uniref:gp129 n=1 Tax=Sphingomonas phage PAU TaxID=1150991 RepID=UPI0002573274|nr:gp129 [Sphingomonas phage PAU]AFF28127.1 gp129 [Sphingomonas phage PAU]